MTPSYYKLGKIAIMSRDLTNKVSEYNIMPTMNYRTAIEKINNIQDVWLWRLPTIEELKFLKWYHDMGVLNFSNDAYWAQDSVLDTEWNHYAYYISSGAYGGIPKTERLHVRLVRDL